MWEASLTLSKAFIHFPLSTFLTFHFFLDAPSLRALRHGSDPLDAPDGLGLQVRIIAVNVLNLVNRKQVPYLSILPRYPRKGEHLRRPSFGTPVLHCGSPLP